MRLLLNHKDSPYIRCIGFLYLRYACEPSQLLKWIQPFFFDDESVRVRFHVKAPEISMGEYVRSLFQELDYYGTRLPRLPLLIERDLEVRLRQADQMEERSKKHISNPKTMDYFFTIGNRIRAQYEDDDNPLAWYDAVIDRVITTDPETGASMSRPKFVITFSSYGNTETVTLGDIDLPRSESRDIKCNKESDKSEHTKESRRGNRSWDNYHTNDYRNRGHSNRGYNINRGENKLSRDHNSSHERDRNIDSEGTKFGRETVGGVASLTGNPVDYKSSHVVPQSNQASFLSDSRKRNENKTSEELAVIAEKRRKLISRYA
jgi:pre-mRNA-splicing factor 38B